MKILIDIGHPAHVHYFKNFISVFCKHGNSVIITARDKEVTHNLLSKAGLPFTSRGKGSSGFFGKIFYIPQGDNVVYKIAKQNKIDLFLSFASPYAAHAAWLLKKPHIAFDDTEAAKFGHVLYKPFTNVFVNPKAFKLNYGKRQIRFDGFIELCHLHPNYFKADESIFQELGIARNDRFIVIRFVSWEANHDFLHQGMSINRKIELVNKLSSDGKVFISSEANLPDELEKYRLKISPDRIHHVLAFADLYIGEGATMASECAMLGTPAIYFNEITAGTIEEQEKYGLLFKIHNIDSVFAKAIELLKSPNLKSDFQSRRLKMLSETIDVNAFMIWFIENYPQSFKIMIDNPDYQYNFRNHTIAGFIENDSVILSGDIRNISSPASLLTADPRNSKICSRCILDESVSDIWFDNKGECKYCRIHDEMEKLHPLGIDINNELLNVINKIKKDGKNKSYDCIVGVSGGRDSTYTLYTAVKMGLRPLAVHFDCGWNSETSVQNIKKVCEKLNVHLHTVVADWEEFRKLQVSFLKASVPDADIPTDYAIYSVLFDVANKEGIKYILNGHSFRTEGTSPISWSYMDPLYVSDVHNKFGNNKEILSFPHMTLMKLVYYIFIKRIREVRLLEFIDYRKKEVDTLLKKELDWEYYGGHHHENVYTKFFQTYYLPQKFNIDKRKTEFSALIRSGQITREEALKTINFPKYESEPAVIEYVITKLGLTRKEFDKIITSPIKSHEDFRTLRPLIKILHFPIKIAAAFKMVPYILYLKYAK